MKKVRLLTQDNQEYSAHLRKAGYTVEEITLSPQTDPGVELSSSYAFTVAEICDTNIFNMDLKHLAAASERFVCLAPAVSNRVRAQLLGYGISDIIPTGSPERLVSYLRMLESPIPAEQGKILIFETNPVRKNILSNIIMRFGYHPVFVGTTDSLFDNLKQTGIQFILFNLGGEKLDLGDFIRRSYANTEIKRIPLLAYKDMKEGIFVNEMLSGLHRLTKLIFSPEELYSYLVDILFRKEIIPLIETLNSGLHFSTHANYSQETLSQIYHGTTQDLFAQSNILDEENMLNLFNTMRQIKKTLVKADGLKWLRQETTGSVNTCGAGG